MNLLDWESRTRTESLRMNISIVWIDTSFQERWPLIQHHDSFQFQHVCNCILSSLLHCLQLVPVGHALVTCFVAICCSGLFHGSLRGWTSNKTNKKPQHIDLYLPLNRVEPKMQGLRMVEIPVSKTNTKSSKKRFYLRCKVKLTDLTIESFDERTLT